MDLTSLAPALLEKGVLGIGLIAIAWALWHVYNGWRDALRELSELQSKTIDWTRTSVKEQADIIAANTATRKETTEVIAQLDPTLTGIGRIVERNNEVVQRNTEELSEMREILKRVLARMEERRW